jgi:ribulose kinase
LQHFAKHDQMFEVISVSKGEGLGQEGDRNVILWADHRAEKEAEEINKTGEGVLNGDMLRFNHSVLGISISS